MKYEFWDDFVIEGTEDEVGLWQIIKRLHRNFPQAKSAEIRQMTLEAVQEILESGLMQIGMFEPNDQNQLEYQIWDLEINSIINRIKIEWDELGTEPNIGDIAWLITTEKGEKQAEIILQNRPKIDD